MVLSRIPIVGRLALWDYFRLVVTLGVLAIEFVLRIFFEVLPLGFLLNYLRKKLPLRWITSTSTPVPTLTQRIGGAQSTEQLITYRQLPCQTHYCSTQDGYILCLHRIPRPGAPVVLLWHGFMMCSEVWVSHPDMNNSLAFTLYKAGYDVWLGNTRGNKYSCKHKSKSLHSKEFWDFSMDQFAAYDLPNSVDYILKVTEMPNLSYVGFSQGTTQGFAALALNEDLCSKVNLFIALAATMLPKGIDNQLVNSLVNANPDLIYLLFGRRRMIPSAVFWTNVLPRHFLVRCLDVCMKALFGWRLDMISNQDKHAHYPHLYSFTSVKSNVHWFQIMKNRRFQMYDENPSFWPYKRSAEEEDLDASTSSSYGRPIPGFYLPSFPTSQIKVPVAVLVGGRDSLPDVGFLKRNIGNLVYWLQVDEYEHLDFLWGKGVDRVVISPTLALLSRYNHAPLTKRALFDTNMIHYLHPSPQQKQKQKYAHVHSLPSKELQEELFARGRVFVEVDALGNKFVHGNGRLSIHEYVDTNEWEDEGVNGREQKGKTFSKSTVNNILPAISDSNSDDQTVLNDLDSSPSMGMTRSKSIPVKTPSASSSPKKRIVNNSSAVSSTLSTPKPTIKSRPTAATPTPKASTKVNKRSRQSTQDEDGYKSVNDFTTDEDTDGALTDDDGNVSVYSALDEDETIEGNSPFFPAL